MKIFVWILLAGLSCFNCKKANDDHINESPGFLVGKWELHEVHAGMTPGKNYAPGNGTRLEFTSTTYKRFSKGILTMSGNYTVVFDNTVMYEVGLVLTHGEFDNRIIFDADTTAPKTFINISNNKLTLLSGFFPLDGGSSIIYQRK